MAGENLHVHSKHVYRIIFIYVLASRNTIYGSVINICHSKEGVDHQTADL